MYEAFDQPAAWGGLGGDLEPEMDMSPGESPEEEQEYESLEATYVLFKEEPGFDDLYDKAGDYLKAPGGMLETFKCYPVNIGGPGKRVLYQARFEMGQKDASFQHPDGVLAKAALKGTVAGFIDFLTGFPVAVIELQALVGEISSRPDIEKQLVESVQDPESMVPAFPKTLFGGYDEQKILMNLMYLPNDYSDFMAADLAGEPKPAGLRWWLRTNLMADVGGAAQKFPYPGEFLALAVRLMPDRVSFEQESSPFLFSGCFADTVYFSGAFIQKINDPTDDRPYPTYTVLWRNEVIKNVVSTDWTEFLVNDRVVLLKNIETTKTSQRWKDSDAQPGGFDVTKWAIAPIYFFGIDPDKKE